MVSIKEVDPELFINKLAERLKNEKIITQPEWALYVKTGVSRERPPENPDWWYIRAASILRRIAIDGPVGVSRLRTYYGSRQRRGSQPEKFRKGSGKIIRTILQQFEKAGLIEQIKDDTTKTSKKYIKKGRILTKQGEKLINEIIKSIMKG
jgi:small subunit ribosomal protein S19e